MKTLVTIKTPGRSDKILTVHNSVRYAVDSIERINGQGIFEAGAREKGVMLAVGRVTDKDSGVETEYRVVAVEDES